MVLLLLFVLALIGMLAGNWRVVLYPSLVAFGVLIALGVAGRSRAVTIAMPAGVTAVFLAIFVVLDLMSVSAPTGSDLVLGLAPTTALYLYGVAPAFLFVGLLFGLTFRAGDVAPADDVDSRGRTAPERGTAR